MNKAEIADIEVEVLKESIFRRYGYDFRHYTNASFKRRTEFFLSKTDLESISDLVPGIIHDKSFFESFFYTLCITVTEMFRDPHVFKAIRQKIVPVLKTFPHVKIWIAGCATGEEAYSMAIMLQEESLYDRSQIYATDFNEEALDRAKKGIYSMDNIKEFTSNYQKSGGRSAFSEYYRSKYGSVIFDNKLKKNIVFANHNLASDSVFGEVHLIMCRNVLIYFDSILQNRVLTLFTESIARNGFLCLGTKETISFSDIADKYDIIAKKEKIYQYREKHK